MPIYEYECDCSEYEEVCSVDDRDKLVGRMCPLCASPIRRKVSKCDFQLKEGGVGWANSGYTGLVSEVIKNKGSFKSE